MLEKKCIHLHEYLWFVYLKTDLPTQKSIGYSKEVFDYTWKAFDLPTLKYLIYPLEKIIMIKLL